MQTNTITTTLTLKTIKRKYIYNIKYLEYIFLMINIKFTTVKKKLKLK